MIPQPDHLSPALLVEWYRIEDMMRENEDRVMDESGHQQLLFRLLKKLTPFEPLLAWVHSVPNGGGKLPKATAGRLIGEGLKSGVFDINLDVARGQHHGLKIEMKVPKVKGIPGMTFSTRAGVPSEEQLKWHAFYLEQGYRAEICYGWRAALDVITDYLRA